MEHVLTLDFKRKRKTNKGERKEYHDKSVSVEF